MTNCSKAHNRTGTDVLKLIDENLWWVAGGVLAVIFLLGRVGVL